MSDILIPQALQIVVDDLGWFCGDDDREFSGASRSGMPRRHCYKDYEAVNALGEALDQKIFCAFVLGEWDPDNRLKKFPTISKYGDNWDNARFIDKDEVKRCVRVINDSPYIEFAVHGIGHGYYSPENVRHDSSDYYWHTADKKKILTGDGYIRDILDSFFGLMEYHGIKKEIRGLVPPSGAYRFNELSYILIDYGIKYVSTPFRGMSCEACEKPVDIGVEDSGVIVSERYCDLVKWDSHSVDYDDIPPRFGCYGSHWPNWLHEDPDRNMEVIKSAVKYFQRCSENQETVISKDMRFAVTQTLFWKYTVMTENEKGETVIDIANVPRLDSMNKSFCVNSRFPIIEVEGAKFAEFDRKRDFVTYEITPESNVIILK